MTINEKLSQIKKTIEEIKNITEKLGNDNALESKIEEMTKEISKLKKGIGESVDELDQIVGEEDARS
jgi:prefoldin subunit 5